MVSGHVQPRLGYSLSENHLQWSVISLTKPPTSRCFIYLSIAVYDASGLDARIERYRTRLKTSPFTGHAVKEVRRHGRSEASLTLTLFSKSWILPVRFCSRPLMVDFLPRATSSISPGLATHLCFGLLNGGLQLADLFS